MPAIDTKDEIAVIEEGEQQVVDESHKPVPSRITTSW